MSGFLRGYLRDEPIEDCCKYANACGAFAVSRHGCAPAVPSWTELALLLRARLDHQGACARTRRLEQIHWSTTRTQAPGRSCWRWPSTIAPSSRRWRTPPSITRRAHSALQEALPERRRAQAAARPARLRHPARRPARPGGARRRHRRWHLDRPADRAAGRDSRSASRAAPMSAARCANGRRRTASSAWCSTTRTIPRRCRREQEAQVASPVRRLPARPATSCCSRSSRAARRRRSTTRTLARALERLL